MAESDVEPDFCEGLKEWEEVALDFTRGSTILMVSDLGGMAYFDPESHTLMVSDFDSNETGIAMKNDTLGDESFQSLLERARTGSAEALNLIVDRFSPSVYRSIRRSLIQPLRQTTDSDDIAQSVWKSFFAFSGRNLQMTSPAQLRGFLSKIAAHKTIDRGRRYFAQKRDGDKRVSSEYSNASLAVLADRRKDSPSEVLIAKESLEALENSVPRKFAAVFRKRAEGASIAEISEELEIPLRSLHRLLKNARLSTGK